LRGRGRRLSLKGMSRLLLWVGLVALAAGACADPPRGRAAPGEQVLGGAGDAGSTSVASGESGEGGATSSDGGAAGDSPDERAGGASSTAAGAVGQVDDVAGAGGSSGAPQDGRAGRGGAGGATGAAGGQIGGGGSSAGAGGAACECSSGPCCDGCHAFPSTHLCASNQVRTTSCPVGLGPDISRQYADLYCDGAATDNCTRWVDTMYVVSSCPGNQVCRQPSGLAPYCGAL